MSEKESKIQEGIQTLSLLFKEGLNLFTNLGKSEEPTNSANVQRNVKKCIKIFEDATRIVSYAGVFSNNEGIEEIATSDVQYLLLPALLGSLNLKLTSGERKDIVEVAEIYFKDFLKRCNEYSLCNYQFKETADSNLTGKSKTDIEKITDSVNTRATKIQRFKEQKELKNRLETLKENLNNEHVDEEIKRNYFLTLIKFYIYEAIDELSSIDMEKPILEHMGTMKKSDKPELKQPPKSLKPVIITKDALQKAVYGAGYPSLPTLTVQEFYDKRIRDGVFPDPDKLKSGPLSLQEAALAGAPINDDDKEGAEKDQQIETDDDDYINQLRQKDEFKDDHRRGWGNRMNRS